MAVGGVILLVDTETFTGAIGVSEAPANTAYLPIVGIWVAALALAVVAIRRDRERTVEGQPA